MTTTFNLELNSKPKEDGTTGILIRITQNRKHRRISTGIFLKASEFNKDAKYGSWVRTSNHQHKQLNDRLKRKLQEAEGSLSEVEKDFPSPSLTAIRAHMKGYTKDFFQFAEKKIQMILDEERISTYKKCKSIVKKLNTFHKGNELFFEDINVTFLTDFEHHLKKLGNKKNTIHSNIKTIKALYYQAIREGVVSQERNPFFTFKLKAEPGSKEKLSTEEILMIDSLNLEQDSMIWHIRNYFLFSFYSAGMRVSDLMLLEWKNVVNGRLEYRMGKTGKLMSIKIHSKSLKILNHYRDGKPKSNGYVFPIINKYADMNDSLNRHNEISRQEALLNKYLKQIAKKAGINKVLSMHVARHSFANLAKQKGIELQKNSELLGHSNKQVTEQYLNSFTTQALDESLQKILNF